MRKLFLLTITTGLCSAAFAQKSSVARLTPYSSISSPSFANHSVAAKTTAVGDTFALTHFSSGDTIAIYSAANDIGLCLGTNAFGNKGYAERYDFSGMDSSVKVIGVFTLFGGNITPTSTKTVDFHVWKPAAKTAVTGTPNYFYSGLPGTSLASQTVPITDLGIGISVGDTAADTSTVHLFATPTAYIGTSFFVGFTMNYTWASLAGDSIGVYSNLDGERADAYYTPVSATDTTINDRNAILFANDTWHDGLFENPYLLRSNYFLRPIVIIGAHLTSVASVTRNDFTFFGNYPNPCVNSTNVKFSIAKNTDVTIQVMDMTGRVVNTIKETNMTAGEHVVTVNTANLAAGEYLYVINTAAGDGIASKMTVTK